MASCESVNGRYRIERIFRPIDRAGFVRDCTLFVDEDEDAYFIYDRQMSEAFNKELEPFERCLHAVRLTDDYLDASDTWVRLDACDGREAPCMFKKDGVYYLITSGLTGWEYNEAEYYVSSHPLEGWKCMGNPCAGPGASTTFNSQPTQVIAVNGYYYLLCERHNTRDFLECSHILLPIEFGGDCSLTIRYAEEVLIKA